VGFSVVAEINPPWEQEEVPDNALLFMRVHRSLVDEFGQVMPRAFVNHSDPNDPSSQPGMSTDWEKYSSAEECRQKANQSGKQPANYAVVQMRVGEVRGIPEQSVVHSPINEPPIINRAHTDVFGEKDEEVRLSLFQISAVALSLPQT